LKFLGEVRKFVDFNTKDGVRGIVAACEPTRVRFLTDSSDFISIDPELLEKVGEITRGYVARDLAKLCRAACVHTVRRTKQIPKSGTFYFFYFFIFYFL
jgi:hypothetical protein